METLVEPFSEGVTIGEGLKEFFPQSLEKPCNAAILVYNYKYDPEKHPQSRWRGCSLMGVLLRK